ncbi:MAG: hypothetical protein ACKOU7_01825 [Ferruginibacter sp.]
MEIKQNSSSGTVYPHAEEELGKCIDFLHSIGIKTIDATLTSPTFLPGLSVKNGCIVIDRRTLKFPGDILHEAGHIAVVPAADRDTLDEAAIGKRENRGAEEMMAIAWSYAACIHLGIDPAFVFHDNGYKGGGSYIAENFKEKRYFGLPMLQWKGMALDEASAARQDLPAYPNMLKWMLD